MIAQEGIDEGGNVYLYSSSLGIISIFWITLKSPKIGNTTQKAAVQMGTATFITLLLSSHIRSSFSSLFRKYSQRPSSPKVSTVPGEPQPYKEQEDQSCDL